MNSSLIRRFNNGQTKRITGFLLGGLAATTVLAGCSAESGVDAAEASVLPAAKVKTDLNAMVGNGVPGGIIFIRNGNDTVSTVAGRAELKPKRQMKASQRYRIGSETKSMVAAVAFQLAEEGQLKLKGTVDDWFPGLIANGSDITILDLLKHTSGIPDYLASDQPFAPYIAGHFNHVWKPTQLIGFATSMGTSFAPGSRQSYSNTNYTILSLIIQKASGKTLSAELRSRIFKPVGMNRSSVGTNPKIKGPHAHGYLIQRGADPLDVTGVSPSVYWGAGNVISTVADVADFYDALLGGDLVSAASLAEMKKSGPMKKGFALGAGLVHGKFQCGKWVGHDGAVAGYSSVALKMDSGRTVVAMANSLTFSDQVGSPKAVAAWKRLIEEAACS